MTALPGATSGRRYVPLDELGSDPHIMVDGAARPGTALCLSHWPRTPTPAAVRADLSAQVVCRARRRGLVDAAPGLVTIDHYDEDAVASLALLVVDGLEPEHEDLLVEVARCGDFDVVVDRRAAPISFALAALTDPGRTPLAGLAGPQRSADPMTATALAARHALEILPRLLDDPDRYADLWRDEMDAWAASEGALEEGWASLEEHADLDLAVVRVDVGHRDAARARWGSRVLHPAAVHSRTPLFRVATVADGRVEVRYRYETWVRLAAPPSRPRVDLTAVALELNRLEATGAPWTFDGAGAITGALHCAVGTRSTVDPDRVLDVVGRRLAQLDEGPPAWDPYAP